MIRHILTRNLSKFGKGSWLAVYTTGLILEESHDFFTRNASGAFFIFFVDWEDGADCCKYLLSAAHACIFFCIQRPQIGCVSLFRHFWTSLNFKANKNKIKKRQGHDKNYLTSLLCPYRRKRYQGSQARTARKRTSMPPALSSRIPSAWGLYLLNWGVIFEGLLNREICTFYISSPWTCLDRSWAKWRVHPRPRKSKRQSEKKPGSLHR